MARVVGSLLVPAIYFISWGVLLAFFPRSLTLIPDSSMVESSLGWKVAGIAFLALGSGCGLSAFRGTFSPELAAVSLIAAVGSLVAVASSGFLPLDSPLIWSLLLFPGILSTIVSGSRLLGPDPDRQARVVDADKVESAERMLEGAFTQHGNSLLEMSRSSPLLLVFLRHFGCTFCREALAELASKQTGIHATGSRIVFVHMSTEEEAQAFFDEYGMADTDRVSDPKGMIYRTFQLRRGGARALFGWNVLKRGFEAGWVRGHGIGLPAGDIRQMPGAFLIYRGEILKSFRHKTAADRPDYVSMTNLWPFNLTLAAHGLAGKAGDINNLEPPPGGVENN